MTLEQQLLQYIVSGITNGSIYALIALGFVAIYSVTGIINFAQGEFAMLGALLMVSLTRAGLPVPAALLITVALVALAGAVVQRTMLHPARRASVLAQIIITIGASLAIRGVALVFWGTFPYALPPFTPGPPLRPLGVAVRLQSLWVLGSTLAVLLLLYLFFDRTATGKAFRACGVNRLAARLAGINPERMSLLAFALAGGLGAIGGIIIAPIILATYDMGVMLGVKGFVAAVMGGLTGYSGAVAGGGLLGLLESLTAGLLASGYKDAVGVLLLFVILLARPPWLFRAEEAAGEGT
ncbi:MAG: branched-chain amino acid ABC transporter permease [Deltaproteobacteria bacterium]|nr:branched-chain amino acid ABC transporter permease [Deltaproteobacteria bacterium]